ncbi:hypothetical protein CRG98_012636 [Punica granatum]|uniref:Uncharacterized protein n=1 Tax=Punica granatum TaxID=22663 RepID=A0A2I0KEP0_PUNGR|nr:hypothetical protein CRG98_012636 [Punica granatum]
MDSKYWIRSPESSKYRGCYAVGTWWLASIAICRTIKNLLDNGISFGLLGRPMESFCFGDVNGGPTFRGPDARPLGLLLALHGHIETFSKVPKRLYRLFDAPVNLGPFSSGCRRAAAFVTCMGNFVQIWLPPNGVFDLAGSILLSVEFARAKGSNDSTSECVRRVGRDHSPIGDVTVLVTFAAGGQGHALFVRTVACDLLRREGWDSVSKFHGVGREVFIVLIMVIQVGSSLCLRRWVGPWATGRLAVEGSLSRVWESSFQVVVGRRVPHLSTTSRYSNLVLVRSIMPSAFRDGSVRSLCAGGLCRGVGRRPRTVLSMDGGFRLKGVNSLKRSDDLWGPVRWHSRLDPFPYSELLTNLASYFGARGILDEGHACAKPMQRGLGVSTFPWRRTADAHEKESSLTVYDL